MSKTLKWICDHKKGILIGAGVTVVTIAGIVLAKKIPIWIKFPYKVSIRVTDKEAGEALKGFLFGSAGLLEQKTYDRNVILNVTSKQLKDYIAEVVNDESVNSLYSAMVLKLPIEI